MSPSEATTMIRRQTLASEVELQGVGLHSGRPVRMRLMPAGARSGVVFVRTDSAGAEIPGTLDHAGPSFYATVLERDGIKVSTIEHLMAALYALQIDDQRVELDGPEPPILDGSSRPFVDAILDAGRVELDHVVTLVGQLDGFLPMPAAALGAQCCGCQSYGQCNRSTLHRLLTFQPTCLHRPHPAPGRASGRRGHTHPYPGSGL